MSKLFTFLESFEESSRVSIRDESGRELFAGVAGDVPQRISNQTSVIRGKAYFVDGVLVIPVRHA